MSELDDSTVGRGWEPSGTGATRSKKPAETCRSNANHGGGVKCGMASKSAKAINRIDKHERPMGNVAKRLRGMGLEVTEGATTSSYDLLINDQIRVTLRVAYPGLRRHRVTVGGRSYRYRYETWHFNFHHHGRLDERYTDFFVCMAMDPKEGKDRVYVIPWSQVSGKTFSLHSGRGTYRGRYAPFADAWDSIALAARGSMRRVA